MTYRRAAGTFDSAITAVVRAVGRRDLARRAGVSASRLDQYMNPMRADLPPLERALSLDLAAARAGLGCPLYEAYGQQLTEAGALSPRGATASRLRLEAAVRAFMALARRGLEDLERAMGPEAKEVAA